MDYLRKYGFFLLLVALLACGDDDDDDDNNDMMDETPTGSNTVAEQLVAAHNIFRSEVGVADIEWSETLAASAQDWADQLGTDCSFVHSNSGFGENIWAGTAGAFDVEDVVNTWGDEKQFYDEDSNECVGGECLHYTQIVWANSTEVGCGMITCDGVDIWVCQYNPAGNIIGQRPY